MPRFIAILCLLALGAAGCAPGTSPPASAALRPAAWAGGHQVVVQVRPTAPARRLQAPVPVLTIDDISYAYVKLYASDPTSLKRLALLQQATCEVECLGASPEAVIGPIARADLGQAVVFGNLLPGATYYLVAEAYRTAAALEFDERISTTDGTSQASFTVDGNGTASVVLPIRLNNVAFSASTTVDVPALLEGGYADPPASTVETITTSSVPL